ncbi:MAG TPA: SMI1/KNR4 family protein, partial [Afifellaceae bacterium]|nr:SMI1/KNR4 family protein [Afifellaceae bacterium]
MASDHDIPEELDEFLPWLKVRTEAAWVDFETATLEEFRQSGVGGVSWRAGTKWQVGLDSEAIGDLEERWNVRFPEDYRQFLSLLNAPDRGVFSTGWSDEPPYDLQACDDEPSFFDWRRDEEALQAAFQWPLEGLMYDVENDDLWPASWGERPPAAELE